MESLNQQTRKILHDIQNSLSSVERAKGAEADDLEGRVQAQLDLANSNCERLDILVSKEHPSRRENAKLGVDQLKYDCKHLNQALRTLQQRRFQREREEKQREELLNTSFKPNKVDTSIMIDHALAHHGRLSNANQGIDSLLGSGQAVLDSLRDQRATLKGAHKKVLDLMNTLGLTNTVMRLIERRTSQDKVILYGGMITTCIVMFLTVKYFLF